MLFRYLLLKLGSTKILINDEKLFYLSSKFRIHKCVVWKTVWKKRGSVIFHEYNKRWKLTRYNYFSKIERNCLTSSGMKRKKPNSKIE